MFLSLANTSAFYLLSCVLLCYVRSVQYISESSFSLLCKKLRPLCVDILLPSGH